MVIERSRKVPEIEKISLVTIWLSEIYPLPSRSFRIMGLEAAYIKIFEFKGLISKIFRTKELGSYSGRRGRRSVCGRPCSSSINLTIGMGGIHVP